MKKVSVLMMASLLGLTLIASACSSGQAGTGAGTGAGTENQPPGASGETPAINVAYMPDMHGATPIVIGEEKGFFEEAGIKVNAVKFLSGPPEFQAMASGDIDIAYIGPGATFLAAQGQGKIITVDSLNTGDAVLTRADSGIDSWADLKGKTVGVPKGTSGEMILNLGLKSASLKPEDVNIMNMDVAGAVSAFVSKKVDAVAIWSPYTAEIEKQVGKENIKVLGNNETFFPDYVFPQSWVVRPAFLEEHPDLVEKFLSAFSKANDYRIANLEEAVKLTSEFTQVPEDSLSMQIETTQWLTTEEMVKHFEDNTVYTWFESLESLFVDNGKMTEVVPAEQFVSKDTFLNAVKK
ncbi:aliphatic sulfonate ABC transporter substrate-binding protein [Paenibacillus macerans]|nr:aliphatic sulfonate ABC transporter substrate-binding protein [Paenibacillus macerans]